MAKLRAAAPRTRAREHAAAADAEDTSSDDERAPTVPTGTKLFVQADDDTECRWWTVAEQPGDADDPEELVEISVRAKSHVSASWPRPPSAQSVPHSGSSARARRRARSPLPFSRES